MPSGIRQLQAELTVAGRPDWVENLYGAQLCWPTEYLAIVIRPCLLGHCPKHTRMLTPATKERADRVTWRCERTARRLERAGWVVVDVWDCQLLERAKEVAEIVLEALESRETFVDAHSGNGEKHPYDSVLGAGVAKTLALRECSEEEWIEFLATLSGFYTYDRKNAKRRAIRALFPQWNDMKFRKIWSIARHEMLVELRQGIIFIGPCMGPACEDMGLPKPTYWQSGPIPKKGKGHRKGPRKKTAEERKGITVYVDDIPREATTGGQEHGIETDL